MQKTLSKKEIKELNEKLSIELNKKSRIIKFDEHYEMEGKVIAIIKENKLIPSLHLIIENNIQLPSVYVDKGAIPFIIKGADIMRPGIKEIEDFIKGDIILIKDIDNKKPLAIGEALYSSEELKDMSSGKTVKNLHYVGDKWW